MNNNDEVYVPVKTNYVANEWKSEVQGEAVDLPGFIAIDPPRMTSYQSQSCRSASW